MGQIEWVRLCPKNAVKPNVILKTLTENRWVSLGILILLAGQSKQCFLMDKRSEAIRSTQPTLLHIFIIELTLIVDSTVT